MAFALVRLWPSQCAAFPICERRALGIAFLPAPLAALPIAQIIGALSSWSLGLDWCVLSACVEGRKKTVNPSACIDFMDRLAHSGARAWMPEYAESCEFHDCDCEDPLRPEIIATSGKSKEKCCCKSQQATAIWFCEFWAKIALSLWSFLATLTPCESKFLRLWFTILARSAWGRSKSSNFFHQVDVCQHASNRKLSRRILAFTGMVLIRDVSAFL